MKTIVISLGGSLIIPEKINYSFLKKFKSTLKKHYKTHKFAIVCGGGVIARKYIALLKNKSELEQAQAGIRATRMNALFMTQFFGESANSSLPLNMKEVKSLLKKNNAVFCGALRFTEKSTSDGTAAKLAHFLNADFINLTNVQGLYDSDPRKNKKANFIPEISHKGFLALSKQSIKKHKPGQHFILDKKAAVLIKKHKIKTYITNSPKELDNLLKGKNFKGTTIL